MTTLSFPRQYARTRRFTLGRPRTFTVTPDARRVLFLRSPDGETPELSLWALDVATGAEQVLVDPASLDASDGDVPAAELARRERARESAGGIVGYSMAGSGSMVTFALAGELFVLDLESGQTHSVETAGAVFDPRPNHDGTLIAYVNRQELRITSSGIGDGSNDGDRLLAADDDPLVSWGRADFIAAEEMGRSRGFWWSPDGEQLLACRVDERPVPRWWIADAANPGREPTEIRYPAAGTTNPIVELALIDLDGTRRPIDWAAPSGDSPRAEYLADVVWSGSRDPLIVRQPRDQRRVDILDVELDTGALHLRHHINDQHWVELIPGSPSWWGDNLLTIEDDSDLDRRVLCVNGEPVVDGGYHAKSIVGAAGDEVIITAWTHPTEVAVVAVDPSAGTSRTLTSEPGVFNASLGAEGMLVTTGSTATAPGATTSVGRVGGSAGEARTIASMEAVPTIACNPSFLDLDGLHATILVPRDHDGSAPLPVLLDPYGGPHAQRVTKSLNGHLVSQWFADQGYAVLVVDGRGTPGRGPAFERAVWGDVAQPVLDDQIRALDAAANRFEYLDLERVGIRGWSFGGYLAALAVLRAPDRFHAAIAGAPVTSWRLYDTHYTERYLGHPDEHSDHYDGTDLILDAEKLARPLMLIHGLADDNVVAAHTLQLSSALLAAGRSHEVLPLSGVTHMTPQEVVAENLLHLQRDFLAANLVSK